MIDESHDPALQSWVSSANASETPFPIQNLPFGSFRVSGAQSVGVAIGDQLLHVSAAAEGGLLTGAAADACRAPNLDQLLTLGRADWRELRGQLSRLLRADREGSEQEATARTLLVDQSAVEMVMPMTVGDYTDFYASVHHATNVGSLFRPDNPLLPNYHWVPIGYHGRASTLVSSGTPIRRPWGQRRPTTPDDTPPFSPSVRLDYEVEVGAVIGGGNRRGQPIGIDEAENRLFGLCLVNDWSARDVQAWEYQPLGPFLGKSFATTISPWIVTTDALAPYRTKASDRAPELPQPLPYLTFTSDVKAAFDVELAAWIRTAESLRTGKPRTLLSRSNLQKLHWTFAQMITHHASNGCEMRPGDLLASGTVSGETPDSRGCLLELTKAGAEPISIGEDEERTFLEDGDEVTLTGWCEASGFRSIGFGECTGVVTPAIEEFPTSSL